MQTSRWPYEAHQNEHSLGDHDNHRNFSLEKTWRFGDSGHPKTVTEKVKIFSSQGSTVTTGNIEVASREITPGLRKSLFTMRKIICWNSLPREVMEYPLLEIYRTVLYRAMGHLI